MDGSFRSGFSVSLGSVYCVQAGEIDALHLINLLKQKGVLTQEEADRLMNEGHRPPRQKKRN